MDKSDLENGFSGFTADYDMKRAPLRLDFQQCNMSAPFINAE